MHVPPLYGAIEAGGTKFVCAVAREPQKLLAQTRITTTTPAATLEAALAFFAEQEQLHGALASIGIASFGPLDLRKESNSFGHILATPKTGWSHTDLRTPFLQRFRCPVAIDTDVNAAALAEATLGAGSGCDTLVYVTVGTGIGGGIYTAGRTHKGRLHPEFGHIRLPRHPADRDFKGTCPFHGDCLEGLASGPAIRARFGAALDALPPDHPAFEIIGYYLGQLASTLILLLAPDRLVFGGGVMQQAALFPLLHATAASLLNAYAGLGDRLWLDQAVLPPALGADAGIIGAMLLATEA
jgi:fructokinase